MKRALLKLIRLIVIGILEPLARFMKVEWSAFFRSQKPKLTTAYWKQKWARLRTFNWRRDRRSVLRIAYRSGLYMVLLFTFFYLLVYMGAMGAMPSRNELKSVQNNTASEVYAAGGELLGRYYIQDRTNVKYTDIAPAAIHALVATEDARFYEHAGVDVRSLGRVIVKSILMQDQSAGGGSTLSQQLAKNLYPRKNFWFWDMPVNKLREIIIARKLEGIYSKEELLELYLNTVPMGGNLYGIERASSRFFNKSAADLKTEEAAVLIGMLKATTTYNPRLNPEKSKTRRNVVLNQMVKYGYLEAGKAEDLKKKPLKLDYTVTNHNDGMAPYFREQLRQELVEWVATKKKKNGDPYNLYTDGLKIYTTIDAGMQEHAEKAVRNKMAALQRTFDAHWNGRNPWGRGAGFLQEAMRRTDRYKKAKADGKTDAEIIEAFRKERPMIVFSWQGNKQRTMSPMDSLAYYHKFLNAGLLSMDPYSGEIKAWVGGINHHVFKYDHVRSRRQVGSTFKPIVYAAALERGVEPCTWFPNERITYPEYDDWSPRNATDQYGGEYTMRGGLAHSVNTVSAQVMMKAGVNKVVDVAHRLGIESDIPEVPSLALGVADLSLYEMVNAYATIANQGYKVEPVYIRKIEDRSGKVLHKHRSDRHVRRAISESNAAIMLYLMQGVVEEGSAAKLRSQYGLQMDIAGKTGTTQDNADGWFIGITPNLVTGVWVGAESPKVRFRTLALGQGSSTALPIWGDFNKQIALDPAYVGYYKSHFTKLAPYLQNLVDCPSFREEPPHETFFERLFDNVGGKVKDTFKDWKEERKKRREERKRERKEKRGQD
ncbi:PBP1A family penicillin-binding protein [Pontibacter sp. BT310]|uniref:PBP1A family penicillin-binding protein n=2 Tax=Hymenobacteraceae TaxID=1853232 RepID=A0ABS6XDH3_9BACT|nr:PBP1A family penicillin-binding protein [Pontibacter sp. BT310]MBJ6119188.1 PBP1A family penicillin-binding protein [Pontibacter sp. BT310]MBW3366042.1 PBP1A family penicillin-binding protein [Pontibacter populi]